MIPVLSHSVSIETIQENFTNKHLKIMRCIAVSHIKT